MMYLSVLDMCQFNKKLLINCNNCILIIDLKFILKIYKYIEQILKITLTVKKSKKLIVERIGRSQLYAGIYGRYKITRN